MYEEVCEENGGSVDPSDEGFTMIKDLARRFALTFGFDQVKNRDAVAALHQYVNIYKYLLPSDSAVTCCT